MCGGALETKIKWIQEIMSPRGAHSPPPPPMSKFGFKFEIVVAGH